MSSQFIFLLCDSRGYCRGGGGRVEKNKQGRRPRDEARLAHSISRPGGNFLIQCIMLHNLNIPLCSFQILVSSCQQELVVTP